eukprot:scaffold139577_cov66-Phaeocystis_antarctica.AAC.1
MAAYCARSPVIQALCAANSCCSCAMVDAQRTGILERGRRAGRRRARLAIAAAAITFAATAVTFAATAIPEPAAAEPAVAIAATTVGIAAAAVAKPTATKPS